MEVNEDAEKNAAAAVFKFAWDAVEADAAYAERKAAWKAEEKAATARAKAAAMVIKHDTYATCSAARQDPTNRDSS